MLGQRIVTAVLLLALLLPALFAPWAWPFALLTLLFISAAGWEWARLNGRPAWAIALGVLLATACLAALWRGWVGGAPAAVWWLAAALWIVGGALALRRGVGAWPLLPVALRLVLGFVLLGAGWLALAGARSVGINFILSVFCLVWVADIAAYFGGRAFGRRKLALSISPGKSWEGAWSGMAAVVVLAWLWALVIDRQVSVDAASVYAELLARFGALGMTLAVLLLASLSIVGDLFESLVKRAAGAKDSSGLLPGHGGVLDRIDALLPVFPIAMALHTL
jgi:phosphatidate cytidylyltransferase